MPNVLPLPPIARAEAELIAAIVAALAASTGRVRLIEHCGALRGRAPGRPAAQLAAGALPALADQARHRATAMAAIE